MENGGERAALFPRPLKRLLGQVLVDGGFISREDLARALAEQARTGEKLGEVLVRLGLVDRGELNAVLAVQGDLASLPDAVRVAAGERERLGELFLAAGRIRPEQLREALEEQRRTGRRLGEILLAQGAVAPAELAAVLAFQKVQAGELPALETLRLGEILVRLNHLTKEQLERMLDRQRLTGKRIGELLVEAGVVKPRHVVHALAVQKKLVTAALAAALSLAASSSSGQDLAGKAVSFRAAAATVAITAAVAPRAAVNVVNPRSELVITDADVKRGYVDVPAATHLEVRSNSPRGYLLVFEFAPDLFSAVFVRGLGGGEVEFGGTSGLVFRPGTALVESLDLSFRFALSATALPGTYAWPVVIAARPL